MTALTYAEAQERARLLADQLDDLRRSLHVSLAQQALRSPGQTL